VGATLDCGCCAAASIENNPANAIQPTKGLMGRQ
jgi:hypothetical protein